MAFLTLAGCGQDTGTTLIIDETPRQIFHIRDYQYSRNKSFDLGLVAGECLLNPGDTVVSFELFEYLGTTDSLSGAPQFGAAHADIRDTSRFSPYRLVGWFRRMGSPEDSASQYFVSNAHFYVFLPRRSSVNLRPLAYQLVVRRVGGITMDEFGSLGDTLRLQLLNTVNPRPTDPLWAAEWRNVYDLRVPGVDYENLSVDIIAGLPATESEPFPVYDQRGVPYIELLGLDRMDQSGQLGAPDGKIDRNRAVLDLDNGLLVFPNRRPFDPQPPVGYSLRFPDSVLNPTVPEIYNTSSESDLRIASKYFIRVTVTNSDTL